MNRFLINHLTEFANRNCFCGIYYRLSFHTLSLFATHFNSTVVFVIHWYLHNLVDKQQLQRQEKTSHCVYLLNWGTFVISLTKYAHIAGLWSRSRRLGLETYQRLVSVSSREKLSTSRCREADVSVSAILSLVSKTNFRPNCASHSTQCERALDVVSLCCSYYCSSY